MSLQQVFFTNPSTILQMQSQIASLSQWNIISSLTGTLTSNSYNIWNLAAIRGFTGVPAQLFMPSNPNNGDFVFIKDGTQQWGNQLYNAPNPNTVTTLGSGPLVNFNGKTCIGACSDGQLINYRQGSVRFVYNATSQYWEGDSDIDLGKNSNFPGNNPDDPWTGWWISPIRDFYSAWNSASEPNFDVQGISYLYFDNTVYPTNITVYYGNTRYPTTFGATSFRTYEPYSSNVLITRNGTLGSTFSYPISSTSQTNTAFILQADKNYAVNIPNYTGGYVTQNGLGVDAANCGGLFLKKLQSSPFNQSPNVSSMQAFDESEIMGQFAENPVYMAKRMIYQMFAEDTSDALDSTVQISSKPYPALQWRNKPEWIGNTGGWYAVETELDEWINVGKTFTRPVISVTKSFSGAPTGPSSFVSIGSTQLTDIYTGEHAYCYPGSNVTLSGFSGSWAGLNGYYPNGVSFWEAGANRKDIDPLFMDYKKVGSSYTGSIINVYGKFLLIKDTYSNNNPTGPYLAFTGSTPALNGKALDFNIGGATPTVSVTHRFHPLMTYNEFYAAIVAFYHYCYGSALHVGFQLNKTTDVKLGKVPTDWSKLGDNSINFDLSTNSAFRMRPSGQSPCAPVFLYNTKLVANATNSQLIANLKSNWWVSRNDPYCVEGVLYDTFYKNPYNYTAWTGTITTTSTYLSSQQGNYHPLIMNYLTGAKFNVYGWAGSGTNGPIESDPVFSITSTIYNTKNTQYTGTIGGSYITTKLFPIESIATGSGGPDANWPDSNYWFANLVSFSTSVATRAQNINANKFATIGGFIRTELCTGAFAASGAKKIAYLKTNRSSATVDASGLCRWIIYRPKDGLPFSATQKPTREGCSFIFSKFMEYLVRDNTPDCFIIDNRNNSGGGSNIFALAEFFGDDRGGFKNYTSYKGDGYAKLFDFEEYTLTPFQNELINSNKKFYVQNNATMYPGCVYRGTTGTMKKLVMLTTDLAGSFGSIPQTHYQGDMNDRYIGSNTYFKMVGSSDPKFSDSNPATVSYFDAAPAKMSKKIIVGGTTNNWPFMSFQAGANFGGMHTCVTGPSDPANQFWSNSLTPNQQISTGTYAGPVWKGQAGGNSLPCDFASTIWPDYGAIPPSSWTPGNKVAYDGYQYIDDGRQTPILTDWTTWRDRWLETAIKEAYSSTL